jgi:hypothetical protein
LFQLPTSNSQEYLGLVDGAISHLSGNEEKLEGFAGVGLLIRSISSGKDLILLFALALQSRRAVISTAILLAFVIGCKSKLAVQTKTNSLPLAPSTLFAEVPAAISKEKQLKMPIADAKIASYQYALIEGDETVACTDVAYSEWLPATQDLELSLVQDGPKRLCALAKDQYGNQMVEAFSHSWILDSTPPVIEIADAYEAAAPLELTAEVQDLSAISLSWAMVEGPGVATFSALDAAKTVLSMSAFGKYIVRVTAVDEPGNSSAKDVTIVWLDESAPVEVESTERKFMISDPQDSEVGSAMTVSIRVLGLDNTLDRSVTTRVTLACTGSATGCQVLDIVGGYGSVSIQNTVAETVTLSLVDTEETGFDISSVQQAIFQPGPANRFVLLDPADAVAGASTAVTIQALDFYGNVDTSFHDDVTLIASGSAAGDGLIAITNGMGTASITNIVAENVTLSLLGIGALAIDVSSTQVVSFLPGPAERIVLSAPSDSAVGEALTVGIEVVDEHNNVVTTFQDDVTLNCSPAATGCGLIAVGSGLGSKTINHSVSEIVALTLSGCAGGIDCTSSQNVQFHFRPELDTIADHFLLTSVGILTSINPGDNGLDVDADAEPLSYSCFFDTTVNGVVAETQVCSQANIANGAGFDFDPATGILSGWDPALEETYEFVIKACDDNTFVLCDTETFAVEISELPRHLILTSPEIPNVCIHSGNQAAFPISGFCSHPGEIIFITGASTQQAVCSAQNLWSTSLDLSAAPQGILQLALNYGYGTSLTKTDGITLVKNTASVYAQDFTFPLAQTAQPECWVDGLTASGVAVPAATGSGNVTVTTGTGTSNNSSFELGDRGDYPNPYQESTDLVGATSVSGAIAANTTWSGNMRVTANVTVNDGVTLTIDPGVTVFFDAGTSMTVNGEISAIGTLADPIYFTSAGVKGRSAWGGVYLWPSGSDQIHYAVFKYGNIALRHGINVGAASGNYTSNAMFKNLSFVENNVAYRDHPEPEWPNLNTVTHNGFLQDSLFFSNAIGPMVHVSTGAGTGYQNLVAQRNLVLAGSTYGIQCSVGSWWIGSVDNLATIKQNILRNNEVGIFVSLGDSSDNSGADTDMSATIEHNYFDANTTHIYLDYRFDNFGTYYFRPTIRNNYFGQGLAIFSKDVNDPNVDTYAPVIQDNVFSDITGTVVENTNYRLDLVFGPNYWGINDTQWDAGFQASFATNTNGRSTSASSDLSSTSAPVLTIIAPAKASSGDEIVIYGGNLGNGN